MALREVLPLSLLLALAPACGKGEAFSPAPPFDKVDDVRTWATSASAVSVYSHAYLPIAVADGKDMYPDATCPAQVDDTATLTLTGDCTDSKNHDWKGTATVERNGDDRKLVLDGFEGMDGSVTLHPQGDQKYDFHADLVLGGVTTITYSGSVEGDYGARSTWSGTGHVKREGFLPPVGEIDATTADEVVDNDVCAGQPVSGSTTLVSGTHEAVITYDGESDCDKDQNAALTVNGEDRGLIDGIACSVRAPGGPRYGTAAWLVALVLVARQLRRRSGPTTC